MPTLLQRKTSLMHCCFVDGRCKRGESSYQQSKVSPRLNIFLREIAPNHLIPGSDWKAVLRLDESNANAHRFLHPNKATMEIASNSTAIQVPQPIRNEITAASTVPTKEHIASIKNESPSVSR